MGARDGGPGGYEGANGRLAVVDVGCVEQEYQRVMEEAKKRDHRTVGKKLDLFSIQDVSGGHVSFTTSAL